MKRHSSQILIKALRALQKCRARVHAAYRGLDWSKSDTQLSRECSLPMHSIRINRLKLGIPPGKNKGKHASTSLQRVADPSSFDWRLQDVHIAKQHGISRERVRQLRAQMNAPDSLHFRQQQEFIKFSDWISTEAGTVAVPLERWNKAKSFGVTLFTVRAWFRKLNLEAPVFPKYVKQFNPRWALMDWRLSNISLSKVWGIASTHIASHRCTYDHGAPQFDGRRHCLSDDAQRERDALEAKQQEVRAKLEADKNFAIDKTPGTL